MNGTLLSFETIPAIVLDPGAREGSVLRRQITENVMRANFTPIELAKAYQARLTELKLEQPTQNTRDLQQQVAAENGVSDRGVRQYLALLALPPEVQELGQRYRWK